MNTTIFNITGTHCKACKLLIEDVCKDIKGVQSCYVDFQTGKTVILHDNKFDPNVLKKEIEGLGPYTLTDSSTI